MYKNILVLLESTLELAAVSGRSAVNTVLLTSCGFSCKRGAGPEGTSVPCGCASGVMSRRSGYHAPSMEVSKVSIWKGTRGMSACDPGERRHVVDVKCVEKLSECCDSG